jgi:peptide/nickel transport system permease protein
MRRKQSPEKEEKGGEQGMTDDRILSESEERAAREKKESNLRMILKRLVKNKLALVGGSVFICLCVVAIFAPVIAPYDYAEIDPPNKFARPSIEHIFGTDQYGRDIFSRVVYGTRWSLSMGICAALMSMAGGVIIGAIAGYFGGKVDNFIMRFIDVVQCIPSILLTICIATALGNTFFNTVIAMSLGNMWGTVRLLRGQVLLVRTAQYVEAAVATNNPKLRVIWKYIIPNSIQPTIISTCMGIGATIQLAAGLSFLGLGIQPPLPEWGAMLTDARTFMRYYPFMIIAPGLMITLTVLSISLLGDGLRDAMDPKLKN